MSDEQNSTMRIGIGVDKATLGRHGAASNSKNATHLSSSAAVAPMAHRKISCSETRLVTRSV